VSNIMGKFNGFLSEGRHAEAFTLASEISESFGKGIVLSAIVDSTVNVSLENVLHDNIANAISYWKCSSLISSDSDAIRVDIIRKTLTFVGSAVANNDIAMISRVVTFWKGLECSQEYYHLLALSLLDASNKAWNTYDNPTISLDILAFAMSMPVGDNKGLLAKAVDSELKERFKVASHNDDVESLHSLYNTLCLLCLDTNDTIVRNEVANQVGDAWFLFTESNYYEALKRAQWVLRASPSNQPALHIVGMIAFRSNDYPSALKALTMLSSPDPKIQETLGLCYLNTDNIIKGKDVLETLSRENPLADDTYITLAYLAQKAYAYDESISWLFKVRKPTGETLTALCHAFYETGSWDKALECYNALPSPYSSIPAVQAIAGTCLAEAGYNTAAEELLIAAIDSDDDSSLSIVSASFRNHYYDVLSKKDPAYLAASFFEKHRNDNEKALAYLEKAVEATPEVLMKKGEILLSLSRDAEAAGVFTEIANSENAAIATHGQLMLGKILLEKQQHEKALEHLEIAIKLSPGDDDAIRAMFECLQYRALSDNNKESV